VPDLYTAGGYLLHPGSGKVLLHHRDASAPRYPNVWAGFGGRSEDRDGGDPAATWQREMREELGISLTREQIVPLYDQRSPYTGRRRYLFYATWPTLDETFILGEGDGFGWFEIEEALEKPDLQDLARGDLSTLRERLAALGLANGSEVDRDRVAVRQELYLIADELRGVANLGRFYAANVYETERAEQTLKLAARIAAVADDAPLLTLTALFEDHWIHVSPALGVNTIVRNPAGELLLLRRADNGLWCLPGGISEIGETPAETALRELWEEAGLRGEVVRLLGVFDGRRWGSQAKIHLIALTFLVHCDDLEAVPGVEMLEARFFPPDRLPDNMTVSHARYVPLCIELAGNGGSYVDPAASYDADLPMHQRPDQGAGTHHA
jgi:8-oxo-dGTP pyrophosphatase MutT (NUDIX family)